MKPGDLFCRRTTRDDDFDIFYKATFKDNWVAMVLRITPPNSAHAYYVLEALVSRENAVLKSFLTKDEINTLIEVIH